MSVSDERVAEYADVRAAVLAWAEARNDVVATLIVGSWARGAARMDSDVDVVVLTDAQDDYRGDDWLADALGSGAAIVRTGDWGALLERRARLGSGLEVEFGFVRPEWAASDPVDPGTFRVVNDGADVLYDPAGLLRSLVAAVAESQH